VTWTGRRVLVTGAGGFIGSHLVERLVGEGAEVTAFIRYTSRGSIGLLRMLDREFLASVHVLTGDLRDPTAVRKAALGQSTIFHLGALIAIPYSYANPTEVAEVNVMGTLNVLNAALEAEVERVVHTSTSETYGTAVAVPMGESHLPQAQSPYSASKIGADAIAHSYWRSFALPVATIRPFNVYGPRQSGRAVIPAIIGQALYSNRIALGSLSPTRDFTFVTDTVDAFLRMAEHGGVVGRVVNIGTGREISISDLVGHILERLDLDIPVVVSDERKRPVSSEVYRLVCDPSLANELLGWRPAVSLDEGIDRVVDFLRQNPDWTAVDRYEV